jgi:hypothetical protein
MSDVTKIAATATTDAAKVQAAAGAATAAAVVDEKVAQGFLRRNIWAVVAIAVVAVALLAWRVIG